MLRSIALLAVTACASVQPASSTQLERVCIDGHRFVGCTSRQTSFVAWGFNYDHDRRFRLAVEDYTGGRSGRPSSGTSPSCVRWVRTPFACTFSWVRFPIKTAQVQPMIDAGELQRLGALLQVAERNGLHVLVTGLNTYRPTEAPDGCRRTLRGGAWRRS